MLLALTGVAIAGLILTRSSPNRKSLPERSAFEAVSQGLSLDQQALETARQLAAHATTSEELRLAQDAERMADQEVDLAFAGALIMAARQPHEENAETRSIEASIERAQINIQTGQQKLQQLAVEAKAAKGMRKVVLQQEIADFGTEVSLSQDELADAQQHLTHVGDNPRARIQQLLQEHEAFEHANGSVRLTTSLSSISNPRGPSLFANYREWSALRTQALQLLQAENNAARRASTIDRVHDALEKKVDEGKHGKASAAPKEAGASTSRLPKAESSRVAAAYRLASLRQLTTEEQNLVGLDERRQALQQLMNDYRQWEDLARLEALQALHNLIKKVFWIFLVLLLASLAYLLFDRLLDRLALERKRQSTLRGLLRVAVEAVAAVAILIVFFGTPTQLSTLLGLAGIGLTVVLKDFIISFLGWFALMGRNGIRLGDWVEINGVRGEVIEIGLLRTVLLETGNWTDANQPTGRRVAFLNSYAVEGYFFNFTTSGQWLWDDLHVMVPAGVNPYPIITKVQAIVTEETRNSTQAAEQELARVSRRYGVRPLSTAPAIDVTTTESGVKLIVRYVTRAGERAAVRSRLNNALVQLLHGEPEAAPAAEVVVASSQE